MPEPEVPEEEALIDPDTLTWDELNRLQIEGHQKARQEGRTPRPPQP